MYADDVKLCLSYNHPSCSEFVQNDLDRFVSWCEANGLRLNTSKCKRMTFSWITNPFNRSYTINGVELEEVEEFRDLGVIMDQKLRFVSHIQAMINKSMLLLGFIKRWAKEFDDPYITKQLFSSLVRPSLEYASQVWSPQYNIHKDRIEAVQKQFSLFLRCVDWDGTILGFFLLTSRD